MIKWMAILLLATIASVAQAEEDTSASFRCGLKIGSAKATDQRKFTASRVAALPANYRPAPLRTTDHIEVFPHKLAKTGERRLLPTFTVARFVCSWR